MELTELKPKKIKFKLNSTGREYILRPLSLSDEIWLQENNLPDLFIDENVDLELLSRIIYHQLVDNSDFKTQEITIIDETGNELTETIGGYKLLQRMIVGYSEKITLINCFISLMQMSRPIQTEEKKKTLKPIGQ